MSKYLVTHADSGGVAEMHFDTYKKAMEYMAELPEGMGSVSFTTLQDPDDQRDTDIEDGKY